VKPPPYGGYAAWTHHTMIRITNGGEIVRGSAEKHIRRRVRAEIGAAMRAHGWDPNVGEIVAPQPGSEPAKRGYDITPDTTDPVDEAMRNGFGWLDVNEKVADHFGEPRGSSKVTTIAVENGWSVQETVDAIITATADDEGVDQITKGIHLLELMSGGKDPNPVDLMAYVLERFAMGWVAEMLMATKDGVEKGNVAQDSGGIDLWMNGDPIQLKPVTDYASGKKRFKNKETDHWFYQWTRDGLVAGPLEEANAVNKEAVKDVDDSVTIFKKSEKRGSTKDYHRAARVLVW
jgi:hypothetical protein